MDDQTPSPNGTTAVHDRTPSDDGGSSVLDQARATVVAATAAKERAARARDKAERDMEAGEADRRAAQEAIDAEDARHRTTKAELVEQRRSARARIERAKERAKKAAADEAEAQDAVTRHNAVVHYLTSERAPRIRGGAE